MRICLSRCQPARNRRLCWETAVGQRIRKIRLQKGITQDQLAELSGLNRVHLYRLLPAGLGSTSASITSGASRPSLDKASDPALCPPRPTDGHEDHDFSRPDPYSPDLVV